MKHVSRTAGKPVSDVIEAVLNEYFKIDRNRVSKEEVKRLVRIETESCGSAFEEDLII